jgi:glycosyltransferase involved in cell wall biosynthesis
MDHPLISVIIPTWNRAWSIRRAVDSVLAQEGADFELRVIDDGSDDGTAEILSSYRDSGQIIYHYSAESRGVSAARNIGIRAAKGNLIAFLDSDDEWLPGKLKFQAEYMDHNPHYLIAQCQERWIRGGRRVNPGLKHKKKEGDIFIESLSLCLISPSAVIIRKELFDLVGLFDEQLKAAEDYDLWLRILAYHQVGLLDRELVIRHGGRPDQLSSAPGLDRYRIVALQKILKEPLSPERREAAEKELIRRKSIFDKGRLKRLSGHLKSEI